MLRFIEFKIALIAVCVSALITSSTAWADDLVVYEVFSSDIGIANIEYQDLSGRVSVQSVVLPWRTDAVVRAVGGPPPSGSQVRADWRPSAGPSKWATVRISYQGKVICQNTLDVGDAACYGVTKRIT